MLIKCQVTQVSAIAFSKLQPSFIGWALSCLLIPLVTRAWGSGWLEWYDFLSFQLSLWCFCFWNEWWWIAFWPVSLCVTLMAVDDLSSLLACPVCKIVSQKAIRRVCGKITAWTRNVTICPELSKSPLPILNWDLRLTVPGGQEERVGMVLHAAEGRRGTKPSHFCAGPPAWPQWKM